MKFDVKTGNGIDKPTLAAADINVDLHGEKKDLCQNKHCAAFVGSNGNAFKAEGKIFCLVTFGGGEAIVAGLVRMGGISGKVQNSVVRGFVTSNLLS